jgi:Uma2 family endonuclease
MFGSRSMDKGGNMSVSLNPANPTGQEDELVGHTYRLTDDQYRRTMEAGIITEAKGVVLRDGFLCLKPDPDDVHAERHYRLSVDQYRAMARQDILTTDDRIELLEGWLVAKMSKKPPHTIAKGATHDALLTLLPPGWYLAIEDPVTALDSEPEPDLSIVRGGRRDYPERAPGPEHIALVVEVAESSLLIDRTTKKRLYARSGFPVYWLINLIDNRIEVYTEPTGLTEEPDYLRRQDYGPSDVIPFVIEGQEVGRIAVRDLLP